MIPRGAAALEHDFVSMDGVCTRTDGHGVYFFSACLQSTESDALSEDPEDGSNSRRLLIKSAAFPSTTSSSILTAVPPEESPGMHPLVSGDQLRRRSGMSEPSLNCADSVHMWRRPSGASGAQPQPRATSDMEVSRRLLQARWESYST